MKKILAFVLCFILLLSPVTVFASGEDVPQEKKCFSLWEVSSDEIHPELRAAGTLIRLIMPRFTKLFFNLANLFLDNIGLPDLTSGISSEEIYIEREDGSLLRMRVYSPLEAKENVPGVLWIHGGGYGLGVPETDFTFIEDFVKSASAVVVAPDYTNSTSAPYPAALDDCLLSLMWLKENGKAYGTDNVSKYAAPARETDYTGLPPTLTYIGDIEPFYDETVIYVENLKKAGVEVMFQVFPGCFHGFDLLLYTSPAKEARQFLHDGFIYAVENYFAEN